MANDPRISQAYLDRIDACWRWIRNFSARGDGVEFKNDPGRNAYILIKRAAVRTVAAALDLSILKVTGFSSPVALGNGKYWGRVQARNTTAPAASSAAFLMSGLYADKDTTDILIYSLF